MTNPLSLSFSALNMYAKCGTQYEFRYVRGLKIPPAAAMIVGSSIDDSSGADLTAKKDAGHLLKSDEVTDIARDAVNRRWEQGVLLDEEERDRGESIVKSESVDAATRLAGCHHADAAPAIEPVAIQRFWRLEVPAVSLAITGIIDVQEPAAVRDTKTTAKSPAAGEADKSLQLSMYALAVKRIDGALPETVALDYLVNLKGGPKYVPQVSQRREQDLTPLLHRIRSTADGIRAGNFPPASPDAWWCSKAMCGYWHLCPYAAKRVTTGG